MLSVCAAPPGAGKALRRLALADYAYVQMPFSSLFEREKNQTESNATHQERMVLVSLTTLLNCAMFLNS